MILNKRQLCDLELLMDDSFYPLTGFLDKENYESVIDNMRLINGQIWPIPISLDVSEDIANKLKINDNIDLKDIHGNILAVLKINSIYKPDKIKEAENVYKTSSLDHPGVNYLMNSGEYYLGGTIRKIQDPIHVDYIELRKRPNLPKDKYIIGFQTRNPMHKSHFELTQKALQDIPNSHLLIHPVVGETKSDDIDYMTRVKCYKEILKYYQPGTVTLSLLSLAMRMAGPREALLHAIIRKNWGCTHFIVGRDHAGCGSYYGLYDAQILAKKYEKELGIEILLYEGSHDISGTKLRNMLLQGEEIPEEFVFPEVAKILEEKYNKSRKAKTIFLTGLSSSGKSAISHHLKIKFEELGDNNVICLDGDDIRKNISPNLGFTREERNENIKRIGYIASLFTNEDSYVIISAIAPYRESRDYCRSICSNFVEVYLSASLSTCEKRDVKGLYKKRRDGVISNFIGIDEEYETIENPEITIDTSKTSIVDSVNIIVDFLRKYN